MRSVILCLLTSWFLRRLSFDVCTQLGAEMTEPYKQLDRTEPYNCAGHESSGKFFAASGGNKMDPILRNLINENLMHVSEKRKTVRQNLEGDNMKVKGASLQFTHNFMFNEFKLLYCCWGTLKIEESSSRPTISAFASIRANLSPHWKNEQDWLKNPAKTGHCKNCFH